MKTVTGKRVVFDPLPLKGKEDFVILVHFCHQARKQGWSETEINDLILQALAGDDDHLFETVKNHCKR